MAIKLIIFDFDGTIADTASLFYEAANKLSGKYKLGNIKNLKYYKNVSMKDLFEKEFKISKFKIPFLMRDCLKYTNQIQSRIKLFTGVKKLISELKRNHEIGILTSNLRDTVDKVLNRNKLKVSFIHQKLPLFSKDKAILKILKTQKLKVNEVIYIADEIRDIIACKKAGIKIIAVDWGYESKKLLLTEKPDFIVSKAKEILKVIKRLS